MLELPATSAIKLPGLEGIEQAAAREKEDNAASNQALMAREAASAGTGPPALGSPDGSPVKSPPGSPSPSQHAAAAVAGTDGAVDTDGAMTMTESTKDDASVDPGPPGPAAAAAAAAGGTGALGRKVVVVEEVGGLQAIPATDKGRANRAAAKVRERERGAPGGAMKDWTHRPRPRLLVTLHSSPPFLRDRLSPWDCQNMEEATAAMQQAPSEAAATSAPSNLRFHTKNSFFLGKWTPRRCA